MKKMDELYARLTNSNTDFVPFLQKQSSWSCELRTQMQTIGTPNLSPLRAHANICPYKLK